MEMKRKFQGIWIPAELWLTKDITMQEKLFLVEINSLDNENGCFASNKHFAKLFDISERRVTTVINNLEEKGFVRRNFIYKDGTKQIVKRVLNICSPPYPTKVLVPTEQKFEGGTEQMFRDNNTSNNNSINNSKESIYTVANDYTDNEELYETIIEFTKHRTKLKKGMTPRALKGLLNKLDNWYVTTEDKINALDESIINGWLSVYEPKNKVENKTYNKGENGYQGLFFDEEGNLIE